MLKLALVGQIGSGKSSLGNFLLGKDLFEVGHEITAVTSEYKLGTHSLGTFTIVDMPGYNNNVMSGEAVIDRLKNGTFAMADFSEDSENIVDAFLLVAKTNPRLAIANDLKELILQFGNQVLHSVVVVVIQPNNVDDHDAYQAHLPGLTEVHNIYKRVGAKLVTVPWDNFDPWIDMEENLLAVIKKVRPYSKETFLRSQKEILEGAAKKINDFAEEKTEASSSNMAAAVATVRTIAQEQKDGLEEEESGYSWPWRRSSLQKDIEKNEQMELDHLKEVHESQINSISAENKRNLDRLKEEHLKELSRLHEEIGTLRAKTTESATANATVSIFSLVTSAIKDVACCVIKSFFGRGK